MNDLKVYSTKAISTATFIGGPLAGGYLLATNFKAFNEDEHAKWTIIGSIIFCILFFELIFLIPDEILNKIPNVFFPLTYTAIGYWIYSLFQKEKLEAHINQGGAKQSGWKTAGISILGFIVTFSYIFLRISFITPFEGEVMEFGPVKHQIYYHENISTSEVENIGKYLTDYGYFQSEIQQIVNYQLEDNKYKLYIFVDKQWWKDNDILESLLLIENTLSHDILFHPIELIMVYEDFNGRQEMALSAALSSLNSP